MKEFIKKIVLFTSLPVTFILLTSYLVRYHTTFNASKDQIIILGHPHPACAFNDSLIDGVSNFSKAGQSYFYNYFKSVKLLEQNPHINTVLIEYSNNLIDSRMNDWIWGDEFMPSYLPSYAVFMDTEAGKLLFENNTKGFKKCLIPILKNNIKTIAKGLDYSNQMGGYRYLDKEMELQTDEEINTNDSIAKNELSHKSIEYLEKLIDFCVSNDKVVHLVRSPLHPKHNGYKNEQLFHEIRSSKFSGINFMDFSKFPLKDYEFADPQHLNHKGATLFSSWFSDLIKNGILTQENAQKVIDDEISKLINH